MKTLEVLIEQNALGTVRPMELAAQTPISALLPAIVEELHLPKTDLFGNRLVYLLRYADNGSVVPGDRSLEAAGIDIGAKLALDSYELDGSVAAMMRSRDEPVSGQAPDFHSSATLADAASLPALEMSTSAPAIVRQGKRRWTRRAFLLLGGAVLGAGAVGVGYAAYREYSASNLKLPFGGIAAQHTAAPKNPTPLQMPVPTSARATLVFAEHTQTVRSVAWSPGGQMLASGANDARALIWDTTGALVMQHEQSGAVRAVAWSPDRALLATGATNRLTWFNAQSGEQLAQSGHTHSGTITTLAWSPQTPYRLVSGATDMKAVVWNSTDFEPLSIFLGHTAPVESASWAADNQTVATASHGGTVRVWSANDGQEIHSPFIDAAAPLRAVAFNQVSNVIAAGGDDGIVRLWNGLVCQQAGHGQFGMQCLDMPTRFTAQAGVLRALAWSPDGRFLATGGDDGVFKLWYPARSQSPLLELNQSNPVLALAWSPDGKRIAVASGNSVTLWLLM